MHRVKWKAGVMCNQQQNRKIVKNFQTFGEGAKDKVCSSLFAYSKLNSTFLLGMFFQSSIMKSKIYQSIK